MSKKDKAPVQDQAREDQMISVLGLKKTAGRLGHDAEDEYGNIFELKSSTKGSFGTGRDVSIEMIDRWRKRHWIFANGTNYSDGFRIESLYYCSPTMMESCFDAMSAKFEPDITLRESVLRHIRKILSATQIDRLTYLINRGMTYNNPHIGMKYIKEHGIEINLNDPKTSLQNVMKNP